MIQAKDMLREVELKQHIDAQSITYNPKLGFMEIPATDEADVQATTRHMVGFATPFARDGGLNRDNFVHPITEYADLPEDVRTIDYQGKGVGPRLYNVREAFGGAREKPSFIGLYMFDVRLDHALDLRAVQGSSLERIGQHAGRILRSKVYGLEAVVKDIHDSYDGHRTDGEAIDAVVLEMPPHQALRQAAHHIKTPAGIAAAFMIIRNPAVVLTKIGETTSPW